MQPHKTTSPIGSDLILIDHKTQSALSTVYKYLRGEGGEAVYVTPGGSEVTFNDIMSATSALDVDPQVIGRVWGVSFQDALDAIDLPESTRNFGSGLLDELLSRWKDYVEHPNQTPHPIPVGFPGRPMTKFAEYLRPYYDSWKSDVAQEAEAAKAFDWLPEDIKLDFENEYDQAVTLINGISMDYLSKKLGIPVEQIGQFEIAENDNAFAVSKLVRALKDGEPIDDLISSPWASEFWNAISKRTTQYTPEVPEKGKTPEETHADTVAKNIQNIIRNYQVMHGVDSKDEIVGFLQDYLKEFEWSKMDKEITVEGITGAFPNLYDSDQVSRFNIWADDILAKRKEEEAKKKKEEESKLSAEELAKRKREEEYNKAETKRKTIERIYDIYKTRYGETAGNILASMVVKDEMAKGGEFQDIGGILTPEAALDRWVPSDVQEIFSLLGVKPEEYLAGLEQYKPWETAISPELTQQKLRGDAITKAIVSMQGGMAPEVVTALKDLVNQSIALAPPPEGGRKFFLPETAAEKQFHTYLAGALPSGAYRNTAWEYFSQAWKNFPGKTQLGGQEQFQKYLESLGPTFFARLTPKKERVTAPTRVRPPGGGRLPMR